MESAVSNSTAGSHMHGRKEMFCEVGTYRGNLVAILRVNKVQVHLNETDLKELTLVGFHLPMTTLI